MAFTDSKTLYSRLADSEDGLNSGNSSHGSHCSCQSTDSRGSSRIRKFRHILEVVVLAASCALFFGTWVMLGSSSRTWVSASGLPALEEVGAVQVNRIQTAPDQSIYRGPPTVGREKAWTELWNHAVLPTTSSPKSSAIPAVFHQLYCLDLVRQYTWHQTGYYGISPTTRDGDMKALPLLPLPESFRNTSDVESRLQVDGCIETLRETLLCQGDLTPLPVVHDSASGRHTLDATEARVCRDWREIRQVATASVIVESDSLRQ